MAGTKELETFIQVGRGTRNIQNCLQKAEQVFITTQSNRQLLQFPSEFGYMVELAQSKHKTDSKVLETLKLVE